MIPISLKIKGLYSYQGEAEIDFTQLTSANLFGIFGSVGSGKSTILEAIAFALYGETERLNKKDNRGYNMMNLKSNELGIDFKFSTPSGTYSFTVAARRNSKRFDDIYKFDRKAYKQIDEEWEPLESADAEKILGLSYENFRRTIIIPQGRFQEFLGLSDTDRTRMLKEIFHLQKFELYDKTCRLEKANSERIQHLTGQLTQIGEIDLTKVEEKKKEKSLLDEQAMKTKESLDALESTQIKFNELLNQKKETTERTETLTKSLTSNKEQLTKVSARTKETEGSWKAVKSDYENRHQLTAKIKDLENLQIILSASKELTELTTRIQKGEAFITESQKSLDQLKSENNVLKEKTKAGREALPDVTKLAEVRQWFIKKKDLEERLTKLLTDEKSLKDQESKLQAEKETILKGTPNPTEREQELATQLESLKVQQQISHYAAALKPGESCPLCGSKEHPNIQKQENLQQQAQSLSDELQKIRDLIKSLEKIDTQLKSLSDQLTKHQSEIKAQEEALKEHQSKFTWTEFSPESAEAVEKSFEEIKLKQKQLEELQIKQEKSAKLLEEQTTAFQKHREGLEKLVQQKLAHQTKIDTLVDQFSTIKYEDHKSQSTEEIEAESKKLQAHHDQLESKYQALEKEITTLQKESERLNGEIKAEEKSLRSYSQKLEEIHKSLELLNYNEKEFQSLLQKITTTKNDLTSLNQKIGEITKELSNLEKAQKEHEALTKELTELEKRSENIKLMKNLFKASGFVNYVSSKYLQNLCDAANVRFRKLTRQALSLEVTEDNNFQVVDYLNGGQPRSVKTLSGGQTFQAALSLALALADSVQKLNQSDQNFFFLDEGFGTLDQESLREVFQTLKALRQEQKIVGIISHVEDLKQEIGVYLSIHKDEEKGSVVSASF